MAKGTRKCVVMLEMCRRSPCPSPLAFTTLPGGISIQDQVFNTLCLHQPTQLVNGRIGFLCTIKQLQATHVAGHFLCGTIYKRLLTSKQVYGKYFLKFEMDYSRHANSFYFKSRFKTVSLRMECWSYYEKA